MQPSAGIFPSDNGAVNSEQELFGLDEEAEAGAEQPEPQTPAGYLPESFTFPFFIAVKICFLAP